MAATVIEQYSWNISVVKAGVPVDSARVVGFNVADSLIIDEFTLTQGVLAADVNVEAASHSVSGEVTTTTDRNPYDIRVLKYGNRPVYFGKNFNARSTDSVFPTDDNVITEPSKATVNAYPGFSVALDFIIALAAATTWNPERLYDRIQADNEDNPVAGRRALFDSLDGQNFISADGVGVNASTNFDAGGTSWTLTGTGQWTVLNGAAFSNGTINELDIGSTGSDLLNDVTVTDRLRINGSGRTLTFTNCTIDQIEAIGASTNITVNLVNSTIATNLSPADITIVQSVPIEVTAIDQATGLPVEGAAVYIETTLGDVAINAETNASGVATGSFSEATPATIDDTVSGVKSGSDSKPYVYFPLAGQIVAGTGYSATALLTED